MVSLVEYSLVSVVLWSMSAYFLSVMAALLSAAGALERGMDSNLFLSAVLLSLAVFVGLSDVGVVFAGFVVGASIVIILMEVFWIGGKIFSSGECEQEV